METEEALTKFVDLLKCTDPTYKEWKRIAHYRHLDANGLARILPTRNGNTR